MHIFPTILHGETDRIRTAYSHNPQTVTLLTEHPSRKYKWEATIQLKWYYGPDLGSKIKPLTAQ